MRLIWEHHLLSVSAIVDGAGKRVVTAGVTWRISSSQPVPMLAAFAVSPSARCNPGGDPDRGEKLRAGW